jgi:prolyl-tRNA synthetase
MSRASLPSQSADFPGWYGEVVRRAGLAEGSLVRGAMVIKPYGYAIWEAIQRTLDDRIKATGHENLYFPLLVPRAPGRVELASAADRLIDAGVLDRVEPVRQRLWPRHRDIAVRR